MSKLYIWKCFVELDKHSLKEQTYYPQYEHINKYIVVASTADEALYSLKARHILTQLDETDTLEEVISRVHDRALPVTELENNERKAMLAKWRTTVINDVYPVRWNWVAEQVTPYIGDEYQDGDVLCRSYNAA